MRPTLMHTAATTGALMFVAGLAAFQCKWLNRTWSSRASQLYFWPTLPWTMVKLRFLPPLGQYWSEYEGAGLLLGGAPLAVLGHPGRLKRRGVRGVVNMCSEYRGPRSAYAKLGMEQLWLPTTDHFEPSVADMERAVEFIDKHVKRGHKVYVHCKAGHGRSAAVAMCYLMHRDRKTPPHELQELLASKRKTRKRLWKQPNVMEFYEGLSEDRDRGGRGRDDDEEDTTDTTGS